MFTARCWDKRCGWREDHPLAYKRTCCPRCGGHVTRDWRETGAIEVGAEAEGDDDDYSGTEDYTPEVHGCE